MTDCLTGDFGRGVAKWLHTGEGRATLNFAAANGFPLGAYKGFLDQFVPTMVVQGLENRGMWPDQTPPPADFTWWDHADDLIAFLDCRAREGAAELPIIGVGHSIGAVVTLMAAVKRPDLFSVLVLMDPATSPGFSAGESRQQDPQAKQRLVEKTLKRRERWSSVEEFRGYLPTRPVYAQFVAEALDDYAISGLTQSEDGYELAYRTAWEAQNFASTPDIAPILAKVTLPTLLLFGEHSPMYSIEGLARAAGAFSPFITTQMVAQAGHLIPQENPGLTWQLIERWLPAALASSA